MKSFLVPITSLLLWIHPAAVAEEWLVDATARAGGDGSPGAPFRTIGEAVAAAGAAEGGTVTVKGGEYREQIVIRKGGTADRPLIVRASEGEHVLISGFEPLSGWKDEGGGLFSLESSERVDDLFVDARRQRLARFPAADLPWIRVVGADASSLTVELEQLPELAAGDETELLALIYSGAINGELTARVTGYDPTTRRITVALKSDRFLPRAGDAAILLNASAFVTSPGDWSCRKDGERWKVVFRPREAADLAKTRTRKRGQVIGVSGENANHVHLEGLEIAGGIKYGLYASGNAGLRVTRCVVYANGSTGNASGLGLRLDQCRDLVLDSCIVFGNHINGIGVAQGENIVVKGCEITANDGDGIVFAGRNNKPDEPLRNVRVENCYIHRHFYLGHPDNSQIHSNVRDITYANTVFFMAGQNIMIQQCEGMTFENNLFFGATARHVILGHKNTHHAKFVRNTFAFGNFGAIGTDARGVELRDNVFYHNTLSYEAEDITSEGNLFWAAGEDEPVLVRTVGKWTRYLHPEEFLTAVGAEQGSRRADPGFKNVPASQLIGESTFFEGSKNSLTLSKKSEGGLEAGDVIEINGDGVARRVETVNGATITFAPALPTLPFRNAIIWKWADGADLTISLESSLAGGTGQPGSSVNFAAYRRGELTEPGKRSLPELSAMAREAQPTPDVFVYPFGLSPD